MPLFTDTTDPFSVDKSPARDAAESSVAKDECSLPQGSSRGASSPLRSRSASARCTCARRNLRLAPDAASRNPPLRHPAAKGASPAPFRSALSSCRLCPRECGANRADGERGYCGAGRLARVAAVSLHHGEEPPISGTGGSGTVFFSHCNMKCLFCQNYPISQYGNGREMTAEELAFELFRLQGKGAHNVNFVTPTPHVPQLAEAVHLAREMGFGIPVVYNTNGYDSPGTIALLEGVVDIYLPDAKYRSPALAEAASGTPDYPVRNEAALTGMVRQAGFLSVGTDGVGTRGVLVRHLVLPGRVEETERVLAHLASAFGPDLPLSLMGQYFPAHEAARTPGFDRKLTGGEYDRAIAAAERLGFRNVFIQEI